MDKAMDISLTMLCKRLATENHCWRYVNIYSRRCELKGTDDCVNCWKEHAVDWGMKTMQIKAWQKRQELLEKIEAEAV